MPGVRFWRGMGFMPFSTSMSKTASARGNASASKRSRMKSPGA